MHVVILPVGSPQDTRPSVRGAARERDRIDLAATGLRIQRRLPWPGSCTPQPHAANLARRVHHSIGITRYLRPTSNGVRRPSAEKRVSRPSPSQVRTFRLGPCTLIHV